MLTVYDAVVWGWGESKGLRIPVIRLRIDAITAWWVSTGEELGDNGKTKWFGGIIVPLPIGN